MKTPTPLDLARIQAALMHTQALVARMNFIVTCTRGGWRSDLELRFVHAEREYAIVSHKLARLLEPREEPRDMVADWMMARLNEVSVTTGGMQP